MLARRALPQAKLGATNVSVFTKRTTKASAFTGVWVHTWSPDSQQIAFLLKQELYFVRATSGETLRRVSLSRLKSLGSSFGLAWSPEGRTVALPGVDVRGRRGWFGVDVQTGEERLLFDVATNVNVWSPHWLPDGKSVFYNDRKRHVMSITIDTGETREFLSNVKAGGLRGGFSWLLDSRHVVFREQNKIWAVAVPDGQPFEVASLPSELDGYEISPPRCSPDGKTITFAADSDKVEYWVMENFLPPEKVAAK